MMMLAPMHKAVLFDRMIADLRGREAYRNIIVRGRSMEPTYYNGQSVTVRFSRRLSPRKGDVVVIARRQMLIIHRILFNFGPWAVEKGDGNRYPRIIWAQQIVAMVEKEVRAREIS